MSPERRAQRRKNRTFVRAWRRVCITMRWLCRRLPPKDWEQRLSSASGGCFAHLDPPMRKLADFIRKHELQYFIMDRFHSYDRGIRNWSSVFDYHHEQNQLLRP